MPRLIILLLSVAALAVLALQNLATTVPLVVLGRTLLDIQLGVLLAISVGIGAFLTLVLYGLVGLRPAATSKYQPMGRRVPYPDSSGSTLPPSGGPSGPDSATSYGAKSPTDAGYSSSSAFVSEPKADSVSSGSGSAGGSQPFITPPQETPIKDTPPSSSSAGEYRSEGYYDSDSYSSDSYRADSYRADSYYDSDSYSSDSYSSDSYRETDTGTRTDRNVTRADRDTANQEESSAASAFLQQPISGLKSVFGKKKIPKNQRQISR
ncbi:MAG: hypothetical protein AAFQ95_16705 [Cyanobacteria bacterium J06621_3]